MTPFLQHVPTWVFGLLALLIALGVWQSRPQQPTLRRSRVLPLVMLGLSLAGVLSAFGLQPLPLLAWAAGVALSLAVLHGGAPAQGTQFDVSRQRFSVPGSWVPLVLMLAIFTLKFASGAVQAQAPHLARALPYAVAASLAFGLLSGVFLGRARVLWALARSAAQPTARGGAGTAMPSRALQA